MEIRVEGLEVYAHHGVTPEEQATGGRYVVDVSLFLDVCPGAITDELADTVDYAAVIAVVTRVLQERSYKLLERVAGVLSEELLSTFSVDRVRVTVTKPKPPLDGVVAAASVTDRKSVV